MEVAALQWLYCLRQSITFSLCLSAESNRVVLNILHCHPLSLHTKYTIISLRSYWHLGVSPAGCSETSDRVQKTEIPWNLAGRFMNTTLLSHLEFLVGELLTKHKIPLIIHLHIRRFSTYTHNWKLSKLEKHFRKCQVLSKVWHGNWTTHWKRSMSTAAEL
jgi:hypothetical protein